MLVICLYLLVINMDEYFCNNIWYNCVMVRIEKFICMGWGCLKLNVMCNIVYLSIIRSMLRIVL